MASITFPPQRKKLLKAVERQFIGAGWAVDTTINDLRDLYVECNDLRFMIKCIDETRIDYESEGSIVSKLERLAREVQNIRNFPIIVVFDRHFLSVPLDGLTTLGIFALTLDDLPSVLELAAFSNKIPEGLDERQTYLVQRSINYATCTSERYANAKNSAEAIKWGKIAVTNSIGFSQAHMHLFKILKNNREFAAAAEIGKLIIGFRPDDPTVIRGLEDLALQRGDQAEAAKWRRRLEDQPTTPRSFNDILAKQRDQRARSAQPSVAASPSEPEPLPAKSGLARLLAGLRRSPDR
ncbi:hypothetical protein ACELLULO517_16390 [Acidisoma cellulosilytica]|uniref:Uncharacterized protein n=1 Tax=Acidisoma cellulosilyticum TaxID=2802395 RepID=A0A963Z4W7_9PROT|nr:hypothetical protein [Acidisoma cellulosilyticum]MCB8881828.1 hypothetical protein [Acidisoma cellulosilyticum]